ncbi:hypothetical protein L596_004884 [Steinernema carpocapsae]|uniref:Uncharacterized protein n=1 Tax=Steinernema carpocapsae TaxID=34508 RepID=A0A4U8UXB3_STECR|nr:hypothetical protein L596_004884 [Steinernema carpocapsae]
MNRDRYKCKLIFTPVNNETPFRTKVVANYLSSNLVDRLKMFLTTIQVSVDSNFSARLDSAGLKIERIRLRSINCKLSAKLEIRRRAERRRFRDRKLSDSSDSESPAVRPKTSSSSTRRAKRESPHTSKSLLSSSLPTDTEDEHEAAKDKEDAHSSVNNLSENLRLFSVHNGEAEPAPLPESPPRVPYLFLAQNSEDSSSRLSEPTKRDEFEKISYEREMRNILLKKEAELKPASWNSPKETSTRSNASHVVFERDENGDFRPASTYFRIHRASLPTFGYNDSGFNWEKQRQWQDEQTRQRNTIFEENNIDLVTDGFSLPQESGDADGVNEGGEDDEDKDESQVENNRSEGSEIILEVSTTTKSDHTFPAEVPLTPGLQDLRDPPRNNSLPPLTPGKPKSFLLQPKKVWWLIELVWFQLKRAPTKEFLDLYTEEMRDADPLVDLHFLWTLWER